MIAPGMTLRSVSSLHNGINVEGDQRLLSKLMHLYAHKLQHVDSIRLSVAVPVNYFFYIAQVD